MDGISEALGIGRAFLWRRWNIAPWLSAELRSPGGRWEWGWRAAVGRIWGGVRSLSVSILGSATSVPESVLRKEPGMHPRHSRRVFPNGNPETP